MPLLLNLDETAVPLEFTHSRGNVIVKESGRKLKNLPRQMVNRAAIRCFFTHVAIISDEPSVQALLPQVLFVAGKHLSWKNWTELQASLPHNVFLRRQLSGWSNTEQHKEILKILKLSLQPVLETYQPILSFDAAPLHLHADVIELLGELDMWWLMVPKKLTWLLQPLDTHGFSRYKRFLRSRWLDRIVAMQGRRNIKDAVHNVIDAIRTVLEGNSWKVAFEANGLAETTGSVSKYIRDQLEWPVLPAIDPGPPLEHELREAWPVSRKFPLGKIFASLGLSVPEHVGMIMGAAPEDSFLAAEEEPDDTFMEDLYDDETHFPDEAPSPPYDSEA